MSEITAIAAWDDLYAMACLRDNGVEPVPPFNPVDPEAAPAELALKTEH